MMTAKRISLGGGAFLLGLIGGFFLSQLVYAAEIHVPEGISPLAGGAMLAASAAMLWLVGCLVSALVIAVLRISPRRLHPMLVGVVAGIAITSAPLFVLMVRNKTLFIAQDSLVLAFAGLCVGVAIAITDTPKSPP
jgi:hypothetical protein